MAKFSSPAEIRRNMWWFSEVAIILCHVFQGLSGVFGGCRLFFTSDACTPYDGKNIGIAFKRLLKRTGIRYRCFHNIRHTYATKLFEAGVPLLTISRLLGHSNINITAGTYVGVMPKEKSDAAERLNYLFG